MTPDWNLIRREFTALGEHTFLNTATYGQTPRRAYDAVARHFARRDDRACADFLEWFDDADAIRETLGRLVGCRGEDIAFIPTAAGALSLLLNGIDWQRGDRVLTLTNEFPNNFYGPAALADRGVQIAEVAPDQFLDALKQPTRLAAISTVSYSTGYRAPLEEIAAECERRGILLYVDGTQSVGAIRMDVSQLDPVMMSVDAYKWMLTPNGAGFTYVSPRARKWLRPATVGWRSHWNWRSVDNLHHGIPEFSDKAERYEGGMLPFPMLYAMGEVTAMMLEIGPAVIEQRVLELARKVREMLRSLGAEVEEGPSAIITARWPNHDASALSRQLKERRVHTSARHGRLRVSVHFYNNEADIDRLRSELAGLVESQ